MKKICLAALAVFCLLLVLPLAVMQKPASDPARRQEEKNNGWFSFRKEDTFRVCDMASDTVTEMSATDYLFGVVAAEMPILYETEALKAQAVAAYTFACRRRAENESRSYDLTTDSTLDQSFITKETARERWGVKAEEYEKKLTHILQAVEGEYISFEGEPILAAYHAISPGITESSENVWGKALPYLQAVPSPEDTLSPNYLSSVTLSVEKLAAALGDECTLSGKPENYFQNRKTTASGTVEEITVCGTTLKGSRLRSLLGLRSSAFNVTYNGDFVFTVYGYGHGVGMSQYGADQMAKQGSSYREILLHYYTDCEIRS